MLILKDRRLFLMEKRRNFGHKMQWRHRYGFPDEELGNNCYIVSTESEFSRYHYFHLGDQFIDPAPSPDHMKDPKFVTWLYGLCGKRIINVRELMYNPELSYLLFFDAAEEPLIVEEADGPNNFCLMSVDNKEFEKEGFKLPFGVVKEVTDNPEYSLFSIAVNGIPDKN